MGPDGNNLLGSQDGARAPTRLQGGSRKVVVLQLSSERQFSTLGSTTYKYYVVGPKVLNGIGPHIEDIQCQSRAKDFTTGFKWKLVGEKSVDGDGFQFFATELIAEQTAVGSTIGTAHTNRLDEELISWSEREFKVGDEAFGVPVVPDDGREDAQVEIFLRVRAKRFSSLRAKVEPFVEFPS